MNKKITLAIAGILTIIGIFSSTPSVSAQTFNTVCSNSTTTTTINGYVGLNGNSSVSVWFEWGPTQSLGSSTTQQTFYSDSNFSQQIYGLVENTTYYYRAMGRDDAGTETGEIKSFRTTCSNQNQPSVSLTADDTNIDMDDNTILRWSSTNATSCFGSGGTNGWSGNKSLSGSFNTGDLDNTESYSITCTNNSGGQAFDSVTVNVDDEGGDISVRLRADDTEVDYDESTTLRWSSTNAESCRASNGTNGWSGNKSRSGSFHTGRLTEDTTYRIVCENEDGDEDSDSITVRVEDRNQLCQDTTAINYRGTAPCRYTTPVNNPQPTVVLSADNSSVAYSGTTTIRWYAINVNSCTATGGSIGWAGPKSAGSGSFFTGSLTSSRTYSISCVNNYGSTGDSVTVNVRPQTITPTTPRAPATSLVLITSTIDKTQPIIPTIDNSRPEPGDEINYTVAYQNVGTGAITNLKLQLALPYEVDYLFSSPNNPSILGNTLIFNLGTLKANGEGKVTVRVRVRENIPSGTNLNFPAVLSYVDPSGFPQSVSANVSAEVYKTPNQIITDQRIKLEGNIFAAGFLPTNIFGWLFLIILILILILLARYLFVPPVREVYREVHNTTTPPPHY